MSSSSVARTSMSYVSPKRRSTSGGNSACSPISTRPSTTRRTAARIAEMVRLRWRSSCRSSASRRRTSAGWQVVDLVLEIVDRAVDRVEQVEIGLGDVVDEAVDEDADGRVGLGRRVHGSEVAERHRLGRLPHGDEALGRRDDVDLRVRAVVSRRGREHRDECAEHVAAMTLENRARLRAPSLGASSASMTSGSTGTGSVARSSSRVGIDEIGPAHVHSARA